MTESPNQLNQINHGVVRLPAGNTGIKALIYFYMPVRASMDDPVPVM